MLTIMIRSTLLYLLTILSVRLMGKRQLGELQPSELVVTILISNIATLALEEPDTPLVAGVFPILTLVCLDIIMSWATLKSRSLRHLVSGRPRILISNGILDQHLMKELRLSLDDLYGALRENGVFRIDEVQFAIAETTGKINVLQKYGARGVTNDDLKLKGSSENPPEVVVNDGVIDMQALERSGFGVGWVNGTLAKNSLTVSDTFSMTAGTNEDCVIIRKERSE